MSNYGYTKELNYSFDEAVQKVREALASEQFGILTEIDVKQTLKKKLDKDIEDYLILGACNPPFAAQALDAEKEIGLLLPCNVIVYSQDSKVYVSAILPAVAMSFVDNPKLMPIANQVEEKLKVAINSIQ